MTKNDIPAWIESITTDWDNYRMVDEEEPRIIPTCGQMRKIAKHIKELETETKAWRERFPAAGFDGNNIVLSG